MKVKKERKKQGVESVKDTQSIDLVIKLEEWNKDKEYDRLGMEEEYTEFLGNRVVCHSLPIRPGRNLAVIVESAAVNHRQKKMGYNAAQELYRRVQENIMKKWLIIAPIGAAAAAAAVLLSKKGKGGEPKQAKPAAGKKQAKPAITKPKTGVYSFASGYKDAKTVEVALTYDEEKCTFGEVSEGFLVPTDDSHAAIIYGAQVYDIREKKAVSTAEIPLETALRVLEYLDGFPVIYDCYQDNWGWMTRSMQENAAAFVPIDHSLRMVRSLRTPVDELKAYLREQNRSVQKLQLFTPDDALRLGLLKDLAERFPSLSVSTSMPCNIERNAVAAMRAMNACNLSYFLTGSRNISYDMVCRAMHETGINLSTRFRETSEGGLAKLYTRRRK